MAEGKYQDGISMRNCYYSQFSELQGKEFYVLQPSIISLQCILMWDFEAAILTKRQRMTCWRL